MLLSCFLLFIEFLCVYIFLKSFLQLSYLPTKNDIITLLLLLLISCFLPEKNDLFVFIVGQFFYFFYIVVIYAENVSNGLCLYCLSVGGMVLCQIFAAQTLKVALIPADSKLAFILGDIATLIFSITICCMKILRNLYFKIRNSGIVNRLIIINTYVLSIMCILFFKLHPGYLYYNLANILVFAIILIITNFCVIYYDQQLLIQKQEIQSYQKNLPIYESLIQEIRENQHEYSNRLQSLQILSETCTDYTSLKEALGKYTKDCAKPLYSYPLLQIDKPLLAATLYNLACRAQQKNIIIHFDVISKNLFSHASEIELSDLAATLTQNAIEACSSGEHIYVHLQSAETRTELEIRNPVNTRFSPSEISSFFEKDFSTKKNQPKKDYVPHGIGLYHLQKQVTKLNGSIGADCILYNNKYWIVFRLNI